jgi:hypothetical protein
MTQETADGNALWDVQIRGESYRGGSSDPWRAGTYTAIVEAESRAEALIEVFENLGHHGRLVEERGDCDWTIFDSERDLTIRLSLVPDATETEMVIRHNGALRSG